MWQDMTTYWAWRGPGKPTCEPPTARKVLYTNYGPFGKLADTVVDDGVHRKVFEDDHRKKQAFYFPWLHAEVAKMKARRRSSGQHNPA